MKTIKLVLIFLVISCDHARSAPTLTFRGGVTWKQVFDSGFRPKHFTGLERKLCVCYKQSFWLEFEDREPKFELGEGKLSFEMPIDDSIRLITHYETVAITMEEGAKRVEQFKKIFNSYIIQEITMPTVIDPSGLVDAGNPENNIVARVGEYVIYYGFRNSYGSQTPIVPTLMIVHSYPGMPDLLPKPFSAKVQPPSGYEWYSLDPKVNTPDPTTTPAPKQKPESEWSTFEGHNSSEKPRNSTLKITDQDSDWSRWLALFIFLFVSGIILFLRLIRKRPDSSEI